MPKKTTIQDIANSLGFSRNTVSKALNGSNDVPDSTKELIIQKAIDLKYKHFALTEKESKTKNIALFTSSFPSTLHFGSIFLSALEEKISEKGYTLSIHILRQADLETLTLPNNFVIANTVGIVCVELFDIRYSQLISNLDIPTIFADTYPDISSNPLNADIIMMENYNSTYSMITALINNGISDFGFIGDYKHCRSFNERWCGFIYALSEANIQLDRKQCILDDDSNPYSSIHWLIDKIKAMPQIPRAFFCANDFLAINTMNALKELNIRIPEDVLICGFDDSPESTMFKPRLTTVHIHSHDMGAIAAKTLFDRIETPDLPYQTKYINSLVKYRDSTAN